MMFILYEHLETKRKPHLNDVSTLGKKSQHHNNFCSTGNRRILNKLKLLSNFLVSISKNINN